MSDELTCRDLRGVVFELHRGELSDLRRAEVEEHLETCDECRELAAKTGEMFDAARSAEAGDWADIEPGEFFDRIDDAFEQRAGAAGDVDTEARLDEAFEAARGAGAGDWADIEADELFDRIDGALEQGGESVGESDSRPWLDEAFEAAGRAEAGEFAEIDEDGLFDRIVGDIGDGARSGETYGGDGSGDETVEEISFDSDCPDDGVSGSDETDAGRGRIGWVAVAAAALLALVGWWVFSNAGISPSVDDTAPTADLTDQLDERPGPDGIGLTSLQRISSPWDSIQLFAGADAQYRFGPADRDESMELDRGSLLVEFRPHSDREFTVGVGSYTVMVTGTVFSVEAREQSPRVAVYEGRVRVEGPDETSRDVEAGEVLEGDRREKLDEESRAAVENHVDLEAHREMLDGRVREATAESEHRLSQALNTAGTELEELEMDHRRRAERPEVGEPDFGDEQLDPTAGEPADRPEGDGTDDVTPSDVEEEPGERDVDETEPEDETDEPDSPRQLQERALDALHDEEPDRAASLLEEALDEADPASRTRADILLELARIHLRQLDDPGRAAGYLEDFVGQWPDDPAADAIRDQLCDLDVDGVDEGICE